MLISGQQWRQVAIAIGAIGAILTLQMFMDSGRSVSRRDNLCGVGRPCPRPNMALAVENIDMQSSNFMRRPSPGQPAEKLIKTEVKQVILTTATKRIVTSVKAKTTTAAAAVVTTTSKVPVTSKPATTQPTTQAPTTKPVPTTRAPTTKAAVPSTAAPVVKTPPKPPALPKPTPRKSYPCLSEVCKDKTSCCCSVPPVPAGAKNTPDLNKVPDEGVLITRLKALGVQRGGFWSPSDCKPERMLAVVIPFRRRESHLLMFINYMHDYLERQKLAHTFYVIDQVDSLPFNRAMLFNVGFREAMKERKYTCLVFHDVDNIPVDQMLNYRCDWQPVHMSARTDKWNWGLPYGGFVGGVTKQQPAQVEKMNGFPNRFWGWGGEDDEVPVRWGHVGLQFHRPANNQGNYATIKRDHYQSSQPNPDRFRLLQGTQSRLDNDGLVNLKYTVKKIIMHDLYTRVQVELAKLN